MRKVAGDSDRDDDARFMDECIELFEARFNNDVRRKVVRQYRDTVHTSATSVLIAMDLHVRYLNDLVEAGYGGILTAIEHYSLTLGIDPATYVGGHISRNTIRRGRELLLESSLNDQAEFMVNQELPSEASIVVIDESAREAQLISRMTRQDDEEIRKLPSEHVKVIIDIYYMRMPVWKVAEVWQKPVDEVVALLHEALLELAGQVAPAR
jgi:DNA-directed RNA polymerase specialized sigma subunit